MSKSILDAIFEQQLLINEIEKKQGEWGKKLIGKPFEYKGCACIIEYVNVKTLEVVLYFESCNLEELKGRGSRVIRSFEQLGFSIEKDV